jgi:hypothetical protein
VFKTSRFNATPLNRFSIFPAAFFLFLKPSLGEIPDLSVLLVGSFFVAPARIPPDLRHSPFQYYSYTAHVAIVGGRGEDDKGRFLALLIGVITPRLSFLSQESESLASSCLAWVSLGRTLSIRQVYILASWWRVYGA